MDHGMSIAKTSSADCPGIATGLSDCMLNTQHTVARKHLYLCPLGHQGARRNVRAKTHPHGRQMTGSAIEARACRQLLSERVVNYGRLKV